MTRHRRPSADDRSETHDLLSDQYRRAVLKRSQTDPGSVDTLDRLAADLAREFDCDPDDVETRLHHATLPQLSEADLLDYDQNLGVVRYRDPLAGLTLDELTRRPRRR